MSLQRLALRKCTRCLTVPSCCSFSHSTARAWTSTIFSSTRLTVHKSTFEAHVSSIPAGFLSSPDGSPVSLGHSGQVTQRLEPLFDELLRLHPRTKRASHCMYAWRVSFAKSDSSPPSPPSPAKAKAKRVSKRSSATPVVTSNTQVILGSVSGGEAGADERLERLLQLSAACQGRDVVLVVYRWYGGVQLGSERWKCISDVAKEALSLAAEKGWK